MMGEVVEFRHDPSVWTCDCGCRTFYLLDTGATECAACMTAQVGPRNGWRDRLPDEEPAGTTKDTFRVTDLNDPAVAIKRVTRQADPDDTAALVLIQNDGRVSSWGRKYETLEQRRWLARMLRSAWTMLTAEGRQ